MIARPGERSFILTIGLNIIVYVRPLVRRERMFQDRRICGEVNGSNYTAVNDVSGQKSTRSPTVKLRARAREKERVHLKKGTYTPHATLFNRTHHARPSHLPSRLIYSGGARITRVPCAALKFRGADVI